MPIYEYICRDCRHEFETLVRSADTPSCERCASVQLDKKLSVFSAQAPAEPVAACGSCGDPRGPGSCALN